MKIIGTIISLFSVLIAGAQVQKQPPQVKEDTLIISTPALPTVVKHNNSFYQLKKIVPGVKTYSLDFNETALTALMQQLELSNGSHYEVEQLKALIREQLKPQINPK